jgi:hypothetical protein
MKMKMNVMHAVLKSVTAIGCVLAFNQSVAQTDVFLTSLNFGGTGCDNGDSGELLDVDLDGRPDRFDVIFNNYIAQQGPGVPISLRRRSCNISLGMHLPQGWQFSIADVHYFGYADLPSAKVGGSQKSTYEFVGFSNSIELSTDISGIYQDNYEREDVIGITSLVWSPCGLEAPLNIRTQVALSGPLSIPAAMTLDQVTGDVRQIYALKWRKCRA